MLAHALSDPTPVDQQKEQALSSPQLKTLSQPGTCKPQPEEQVEEHAELAEEPAEPDEGTMELDGVAEVLHHVALALVALDLAALDLVAQEPAAEPRQVRTAVIACSPSNHLPKQEAAMSAVR
jgi:hypothetical protein